MIHCMKWFGHVITNNNNSHLKSETGAVSVWFWWCDGLNDTCGTMLVVVSSIVALF